MKKLLRKEYPKSTSWLRKKVRSAIAAAKPKTIIGQVRLQLSSQYDRWGLWCPVALIVGVAAYFALPREPHLAVVSLAVLVALLCLWLYKFRGAPFRLLLVFFFLSGFCAAKVRTQLVDHTSLVATTPTSKITGVIERVESRPKKRAHIYLRSVRVENLKLSATPQYVRLSGRRIKVKLFSGDKVSFRGRLVPLPSPVEPGGFDFGRKLWFEGLGAAGFYYGEIKLENGAVSPVGISRWLQKLRAQISGRISQHLTGHESAVATALITGDRGGLDKQTLQNLRASGLAHILAISGLHMTLVAGGVFWLTRALLAMSGLLALGYPIKKWSSVVALSVGAFYLSISGAGIATQRAFIMLSIMLLAIVLDRPAISMRNVAIAALLIVVVRPNEVLSVSFQMSFMAVVGLVGFYELVNSFRRQRSLYFRSDNHITNGLVKVFGFFVGLSMTTIIAGVFTGVPAAYHFNTIAVYSLLGNVVALPIVTLVVMPSAILSVLLMPLGLEFLGLDMMGWGINLVLQHAQTVANFSGSQVLVPSMKTPGILFIVLGLLWFSIWRGWLKSMAIIPLVLGYVFSNQISKPDILIAKYGRNVAATDTQGRYVFLDNRKSRFDAERWLVSQGDNATLAIAAKRKGWICKNHACTFTLKERKVLYLGPKVKDANKVCNEHKPDIVIAANPLFGKCKTAATRIDRFDLWREGAHAIYLSAKKITPPQTQSDQLTNGPEERPDLTETTKLPKFAKTRKPALGVKLKTTLRSRGERPWVIKPKARRKILIDPSKDKRRYQKVKPFPPKKNASFQYELNSYATTLQARLEHQPDQAQKYVFHRQGLPLQAQ